MQRIYTHSFWQRALTTPLSFWILVVLIVFFSWIGWGEYQYSRALASTIRRTENNISDAQKRSVELDVLLQNFQEENFQEKLARERFQMKKEGEHVGVIVRPGQDRAKIEVRGGLPIPGLDQRQNAEEWLKLLVPEKEE